jgi:uncharacterized membrane protein
MEAPKTTLSNIELVARLDREALTHRNWTDWLGDAVTSFIGSMPFVLVHLVGFVV